MGYASAMTMALFVILALFTVIQFKLNQGGETGCRLRQKKICATGLKWILLLLLTFLFLMPVIWVICSSFKSVGELFSWPPSLLGRIPLWITTQRPWQKAILAFTSSIRYLSAL